MITGELKSKTDRIWDTLWAGGIANPFSVIKRLDKLHTLKENKANRLERACEASRKLGHLQIHPFEGTHHLGWYHRAAAVGKNLTDN